MASQRPAHDSWRRAESALRAVLPWSVKVRRERRDNAPDLLINGLPIEVKWVGKGWLRDVQHIVATRRNRPDVVAARHMSPGAREVLSKAGIGWVDETGAAEIVLGPIVISRSGRLEKVHEELSRWNPSVIAVAEAILCGVPPTLASVKEATELSTGSCVTALRFLTDGGFLTAKAKRGRESARRVANADSLLEAYASAATAIKAMAKVRVGVTWRDVIAGLKEYGREWDRTGVAWAATGPAASLVLAPFLTTVGSADVFVDARTVPELHVVAERAGLRPIEGGRLTLLSFPNMTTRRLATVTEGVRVAPWPRVYADLRVTGVRGEETAEHLREVIRAR